MTTDQTWGLVGPQKSSSTNNGTLLFKFLKMQPTHQAPSALCHWRWASIELKDTGGNVSWIKPQFHALLMYADDFVCITSEEENLLGHIRRVSAQSKDWNQQVPLDHWIKSWSLALAPAAANNDESEGSEAPLHLFCSFCHCSGMSWTTPKCSPPNEELSTSTCKHTI